MFYGYERSFYHLIALGRHFRSAAMQGELVQVVKEGKGVDVNPVQSSVSVSVCGQENNTVSLR